MSDAAHIGVVAIGRNEGERLRQCLASVAADIPVVYVDSGSSDDSVAFARARGADVVELDLATPFTAARARNEGLMRLLNVRPGAAYVQFVDGDCEIECGWIEQAIAFLDSHPEAAVVCGRRRERFPDSSFYNRMCDDEWDTPVGRTASCGGDAMARVSAIIQAGGFDAAMMAGEEPELCARLRAAGWSVWRLDAPMTIHDAAMHRFSQWWRRAIRSGYGYAQVWRKTRHSATHALYERELVRAICWTAGVSAMALAAAPFVGFRGLLLAPLVWSLQFVRLSRRHGVKKGWFLLIAKAAEFTGAVRYMWEAFLKKQQRGIFYK